MSPKLLVLDDQVQYGRALDRALRREHELVLATTLAEAREKFTSGFSAILTDIRLDESNANDRQGLEFIADVRRKETSLPIIAMSALDDPDLEQAAISVGATRFLRKPIVISQLKALLEELVRNGH
jgi:CheY-like chemotaxis protein